MNEATTAADRNLDELIEEAQKLNDNTIGLIVEWHFKQRLSLLQTLKTDREAMKAVLMDFEHLDWVAMKDESVSNLWKALESSNKTIEAL